MANHLFRSPDRLRANEGLAMPTLIETLDKIQSDPELTKKFMIDPAGTLRTLGVDPTGLKVTKTTDTRSGWVKPDVPQDRGLAAELAAGKAEALDRIPGPAMRPTICGSIGYIVCGSVGD
jgi:hypothetical protein